MNMLISQWKAIFKKKIINACSDWYFVFVPLLYGGLFLSAFWNPYGHTNRLKIAVINQDNGAMIDGKTVAFGQSLTDRLKENPKFDWQFLRPSEKKKKAAEEGLERGDYYMIITIPHDFSKCGHAPELAAETSAAELCCKLGEKLYGCPNGQRGHP
ncbi:YhgE/Pip family protein [Terrilactibacillus sp. S3-3]|nr:YhgE/Pip family protein [Terrilactibacillus sp. S3-3]